MTHATYYIGDVFDVLRTLPDNSVDLVFSSPPFLALRSYLPADHPQKAKEIGSEPTPADYIDTLLGVVEECARVLAPHGSLAFELGDTYAGSGGAGGDYNEGGLRDGQPRVVSQRKRTRRDGNGMVYRGGDRQREKTSTGWPLDKSLCGIPSAFELSLIYGRNILRPERLTDPWRVRNLVAWCRPNPPVGQLADKVRPATSYITVGCKAKDRYFDLEAVRSAPSPNTHPWTAKGTESKARQGKSADRDGGWHRLEEQYETGGSPPLDYWVIPTQPYEGAHYATFPEKLCEVPIKSMCPPKVCCVCGQPSRRITESETPTGKTLYAKEPDGRRRTSDTRVQGQGDFMYANKETVGWTDCGHDAWRSGIVLDPFAGSGTTLQVATGHGRQAIGIDLDERNAELAYQRVGGLLLEIVDMRTKESA